MHPVSYTHLDVYKRQAQILNVLADGYMIGWSLICCQQLTDLIRRSQVADIIHKELTQTLQNQSVRQSIFPVSYAHLDVYKRQE